MKSLIKHEGVRRVTLVVTVILTAAVGLAITDATLSGDLNTRILLIFLVPPALFGPYALVNLVYWIKEGIYPG